MAKTKGATKTRAKAEEPEDEDVELEDEVELDELDDDEVETKPTKKGRSAADDEVTFGVRDLCDLVKRKLKKEYTTKEMRMLLRKMAREDNPRIEREVIRGNKSRYSWEGPEDPEVVRVLKAIKGGEIESARKATLDELKTKKAKKDAAAGKGANKAKSKAKRKAAEEEDEDEVEIEDEVEDFDEDE